MFSVLLLGRNFPDAVGASTMERVIGGLGLVVVRRCFPVISTAFMTSLFDGITDVWILDATMRKRIILMNTLTV